MTTMCREVEGYHPVTPGSRFDSGPVLYEWVPITHFGALAPRL